MLGTKSRKSARIFMLKKVESHAKTPNLPRQMWDLISVRIPYIGKWALYPKWTPRIAPGSRPTFLGPTSRKDIIEITYITKTITSPNACTQIISRKTENKSFVCPPTPPSMFSQPPIRKHQRSYLPLKSSSVSRRDIICI